MRSRFLSIVVASVLMTSQPALAAPAPGTYVGVATKRTGGVTVDGKELPKCGKEVDAALDQLVKLTVAYDGTDVFVNKGKWSGVAVDDDSVSAAKVGLGGKLQLVLWLTEGIDFLGIGLVVSLKRGEKPVCATSQDYSATHVKGGT
jgi:hypothetical protein